MVKDFNILVFLQSGKKSLLDLCWLSTAAPCTAVVFSFNLGREPEGGSSMGGMDPSWAQSCPTSLGKTTIKNSFSGVCVSAQNPAGSGSFLKGVVKFQLHPLIREGINSSSFLAAVQERGSIWCLPQGLFWCRLAPQQIFPDTGFKARKKFQAAESKSRTLQRCFLP